MSFGDDMRFRDAMGDEVIAAHAAFGVDIASLFAAEGDEDGGESLTIEGQGVPEAITQDGRRASVVLGCAEDGDGVGASGLVVAGVVAYFQIDVSHPKDGCDKCGGERQAEESSSQAQA